jgi:hypothetical protein
MSISGFSGRTLPLGEFHLITAERRTGDGHRILDAFLIFPKSRAPYKAVSFRFAWGGAAPSIETVADADMLDPARQWALAAIEEEVLHWVQSQERPTSIPESPAFEASDAEYVLRSLHFRRVAPEALRHIGYQSQDAAVRELVDRIRRLPRLHVGEVDQ